MYRRALRFAGFDVDLVADGLAALELVEQRRPDLMVLDMHLPRLRGESVLDEVTGRNHLRDIPVVVVTGGDASSAASRAAAVLGKPCDPERLIAAEESQLDRVA